MTNTFFFYDKFKASQEAIKKELLIFLENEHFFPRKLFSTFKLDLLATLIKVHCSRNKNKW